MYYTTGCSTTGICLRQTTIKIDDRVSAHNQLFYFIFHDRESPLHPTGAEFRFRLPYISFYSYDVRFDACLIGLTLHLIQTSESTCDLLSLP